MLESALLKKILVDQNVFTQAEMTEHAHQAQQRNIDLETYLVSQHAATTEQIYRAIADYFKYPFISLNTTTLRRDILGLIPEAIALEHRVVAFEKKDKGLSIATALPNHTHVFDFIEKKIGLPVTIHIATPNNITEVIKLYHPGLKEEFEDFVSNGNEQPNGQGQNLQELARDIPVIRIVDTLLEYAVIENASDIHIEPLEREITVRYRIDGILKNVMTLPKSLLAGVVARIKIMSDLKLDEHRLPQDGRFKKFITDHDVSFRVSIIPTYDGEKIVLRLLDEKNSLLNLDQCSRGR